MKKQLILAAAVLALTACNSDENLNPNDGPVELRLSSGIAVPEATRAATGIQNEAFDANESVDVYITEDVQAGQTTTTAYAQPLVYTTETGGGMSCNAGQPYFPTSGNGVNIHAVYPSASETFAFGGFDDGHTSFTIQADQSTDKGYKLSDLMYGRPAANPVTRTASAVPLTFTHLLSKVTITLDAGAGLEESDLADAIVTLLAVHPTATFAASASAGTIGEATGETVNVIVKDKKNTSLSNSAIIIPQTLGENFVQITLADGGVLTGKLNNGAPVLASGNVYAYTITANLTGVDIKGTITPWTSDGNTHSGTAEM